MAATKNVCCFTSFHFLSCYPSIPHLPVNSLLCPNSYRPISAPKANPTLSLSRSRISHVKTLAPKRIYKLLTACGLVSGNSETYPESEACDLTRDAAIDIKLPRRSLLVQFTCDLCGERTNRLVNRLAYERGLIYVQCAGCQQYHKLVDNLGIVVEYDLREETNADEEKDEA